MRALGLSGSVALVTGSCGFIGSHLVAALCAAGSSVVGISRHLSGTVHSGVQYIEGDVICAEQMHGIVSNVRPDFVFHLASSKNKAAATHGFRESINNDLLGTLNLVEACMHIGCVKRFVHLGSCEVYGATEVPFRECFREAPVNAYSFSKTAITHMLQTLSEANDFNAVELRPSVVYGPGQGEGMFIPSLIKSLLAKRHFPMSGGGQTRDFIYIDDLIAAMLLAAEKPDCEGEVINVCGGAPVKLLGVAGTIAKLIGDDASELLGIGELPYRTGEAMDYWADNQKANSLLGWNPRMELVDGLAKTVEYYQSVMHTGAE